MILDSQTLLELWQLDVESVPRQLDVQALAVLQRPQLFINVLVKPLRLGASAAARSIYQRSSRRQKTGFIEQEEGPSVSIQHKFKGSAFCHRFYLSSTLVPSPPPHLHLLARSHNDHAVTS